MSFIPPLTDIGQRIKDFPKHCYDSAKKFSCKECMRRYKTSNRMIVLVVFVAIFIDNMLTTIVVPIIPDLLFKWEYPAYHAVLSASSPSPSSSDATCTNMSSTTMAPLVNSTSRQVNGLLHPDYTPHNTTESTDYVHNCRNVSGVITEDEARRKFDDQSLRIGLLFASKSAVQLLANPIVGMLTNKLGYSIPMFAGFVIIFTSTLVNAFGSNYWVLLVARAIQGAGSSCSSVSGMGLIADRYQDDRERGNAMAVALSGLALGVLVGPTFGGLMANFISKEAPFLALAILALADGALQLYVMKPTRIPEQQEGASLSQLLKDPYILLTAGSITFANMGMGMLEPNLPGYMLVVMHADTWLQGIAFLPASISYLIGTIVFGPLGAKIGRWRTAMIGMVLVSLALVPIPFSRVFGHLVVPNLCLGFAIGMVDSAMMPTMGYLVDLRHTSVYGNVYAIADVAFCIGFAAGPALGGVIVKAIGFNWMLWIIAIINLGYAPLLYFLRNPPGNEEKIQLVLNDTCPIRYVTYRQSSMEDDLEAAAAIDSEQCDRLDTHTVTNLSEPDLSVEASVHERLTESTQANVSQGKVIHCDTDSSSGETEGADSLDEFSSDSEYDE